jgi:methylated-DNA-protein-cysteine methyltransferase-like protein
MNSDMKPRKRPAVTEDSAEDAIYKVVRAIPRGRVATYGQLAELAGIAHGHRIAARAMRTCPDTLSWYRVVGKKDARRAKITVQEPDHAALQRKLLEREGVRFDENGFIVLAKFGWLPH